MKTYALLGSTFILVATLLFVGNRLYEAIKCVGLRYLYYLSLDEKIIYGLSGVFLVAGAFFCYLALKEELKKKK